MPLYDFQCGDHGKFEALTKWDATVVCKTCGVECRRLVSIPARTATLWNSGWNSGLNGSGFYSPSVGGMVGNKREEEQIMRSRGYINESDLGGDSFYDSYMSKAKNDRDGLDATARTYTDNLQKFGGDKARAVVETFPAKQMLADAAAHDAKS